MATKRKVYTAAFKAQVALAGLPTNGERSDKSVSSS